jgi:benzoate 4-monooxygenase
MALLKSPNQQRMMHIILKHFRTSQRRARSIRVRHANQGETDQSSCVDPGPMAHLYLEPGSSTQVGLRLFAVSGILVALIVIKVSASHILRRLTVWSDRESQYVYRIWFHPLADVPGPLLARASTLWAASAAGKLRKAQAIHAAHQKYGPIVRIAPNELSFADPQVLKSIYGHNHRNPKSGFYSGGKFTAYDNIFSMRDITQHAGRRSVMAPVFSSKYISNYVPLILQKLEQTFDVLASLSSNGKAVDVYHWAHCLALDIVFHFTLNHESGSLATGTPHPVIRDLEDFQSVFAWTALLPFLRGLGRFIPIPAIQKPFVSLHNWVDFCLEISSRERSNDKHASFIARLLENPDPHLGRRLEDIEISEELIGILFAGSGTAANTIAFLIWAVLRDEKTLGALVAELDRELPESVTSFSPEVVAKLPYLNAVIMEALRRYPTIPGLQPRVVREDGFELQGVKIPQGVCIVPCRPTTPRLIWLTWSHQYQTIVGCQNYTIHLDPAIFPNPESFLPERWLQPDITSQKAAFNGFGTGPRACIGRK